MGHRRHMIAVVVLVPLLVTLALWAFAWPAARLAPRDLPLGVAGPAAAVTQVEQQLSTHEGAFEIHRYADEAAARDAVENRTVYGAVIVTAQGPKLLTASAASPVVAQLLQQAVAEQAVRSGGPGAQVRTVDVVPAPANDLRGAAFGASVLPLALAGVAAGAVVTVLGLRGVRAVGALVGAATLVGVVAAAIAHSWLGVLTGDWWAEAGVLGLTTLAVSGAVAGLAALLGTAGIGVGGLTVILLGNPFSAASSAPQLLPDPVGTIGQWLPPGASASLLRSVSFFDGAASLGPALTLTWWAALGLGAVLLGSTLKRRTEDRKSEPGTTAAERQPALTN
ncbi:ABC transporter permease [Streptomyces sp. WI04-05B]|uniref:ABC transporter permease n=1 Tax=Streptomyces TaxID=1883 RepID=UPI0029A65EF6|nr:MULTISPECIES: ABC transporter permease [unclassified Streptomyces]MDX2547715.1 ABC transporter permease [Streptomyces sp. WI04-05B]MDX2590028.1 ABC transporter permease [Streptomyces sp. WI04-05A]MDX3748070.1 ABC transporter permease [Streptomyces sp. AK08-02]